MSKFRKTRGCGVCDGISSYSCPDCGWTNDFYRPRAKNGQFKKYKHMSLKKIQKMFLNHE